MTAAEKAAAATLKAQARASGKSKSNKGKKKVAETVVDAIGESPSKD